MSTEAETRARTTQEVVEQTLAATRDALLRGDWEAARYGAHSVLALSTAQDRHAEARAIAATATIGAGGEAPSVFTLLRSGRESLYVRGWALAEEDGSHQGGREQSRWHDLTLYRTLSGCYACGICYLTRYQGEQDWAQAEALRTPQEVCAYFRDYDPASHVQGFPPGEHYRERQQRLLADVRRRYQNQVSALLRCSVEFAERVT